MNKGYGTRKLSRLLAAVLVCVMSVLVLAGCGGSSGKDPNANAFYFTNNTDAAVHNIYMSPQDSDQWGDPLTDGIIKKGKTVTIDFSVLPNGEGVYDFGAIDENYMNYDFYGVEVYLRDTLIMESDGTIGTLTVEHEDGSSSVYQAELYKSPE